MVPIITGLALSLFGMWGVEYFFKVNENILERDAFEKTAAVFLCLFGVIGVLAGIFTIATTIASWLGVV